MIDVKRNDTHLADEVLIEICLNGGAYGALNGVNMISTELQGLTLNIQERVGRWRCEFWDESTLAATITITYDDERLLAKTAEVHRDSLLNSLGI